MSRGIRTRNADLILGQEEKLFKQVGMTKVGFEGVEPTIVSGGKVWYMATFPATPNELYTIAFESWYGEVRMTYMRFLNRKVELETR